MREIGRQGAGDLKVAATAVMYVGCLTRMDYRNGISFWDCQLTLWLFRLTDMSTMRPYASAQYGLLGRPEFLKQVASNDWSIVRRELTRHLACGVTKALIAAKCINISPKLRSSD
jgi:hypothetical protein